MILNAHDEEIRFQLPPLPDVARWQRLIDTSSADPFSAGQSDEAGVIYRAQPRSLVLLRACIGLRDE
jgi:hypothetical protein